MERKVLRCGAGERHQHAETRAEIIPVPVKDPHALTRIKPLALASQRPLPLNYKHERALVSCVLGYFALCLLGDGR
jgi:hypothetical protein